MKYRLRVEAPDGPQSVRFRNVLQGADAGATPDDARRVRSTSGTPYAGAVVKGVAVLFPVDLGGTVASVTYTVPAGTTAHLITGLAPNGGYDAVVQNAGGAVQVSVQPGSTYKADAGGVLVLGTLPGRP